MGKFLGPSEPRLCLRNFVHFALSMVRPPAAAFRDLLVFWGSGGISLPEKRAENVEKLDFPGLGGVLGETGDQI